MEDLDLFEDIEALPLDVQKVINNFCSDDHLDYDEIKEFLKQMEKLGYTFEYQLDGIPFNLKKII